MLQADNLNISVADISYRTDLKRRVQAVICCSGGLPAKPLLRLDTVPLCRTKGKVRSIQRILWSQRSAFCPMIVPYDAGSTVGPAS